MSFAINAILLVEEKQQVMEKIAGHGYAAGFPDNTGEQLFKSKPQSICSISDFTLLSTTGR